MRKENTPRQFIPLIALGSTRPQVSGGGDHCTHFAEKETEA